MDVKRLLRTGTIRRLFATEEPLFRDHLLRLDAAGRRDRFMGGVADKSLIRYAAQCFDSDTLVLGFLDAEYVRAAGELHAPGLDGDLTADVAFSVEPEFRRRGIGTAMLKRLIVSARNRGIRHLRMNCHAQNQGMQALARKFRADLKIGHAETVGEITPRPATPLSVLMEVQDDVREFGEAAIDVRRRLRPRSQRE